MGRSDKIGQIDESGGEWRGDQPPVSDAFSAAGPIYVSIKPAGTPAGHRHRKIVRINQLKVRLQLPLHIFSHSSSK
jgi:hypothetical protein